MFRQLCDLMLTIFRAKTKRNFLCGLKCFSDKCTCRSCKDRPDSWSAGTLSVRTLSRSSFLICFSLSSIVMAFFRSLVWCSIQNHTSVSQSMYGLQHLKNVNSWTTFLQHYFPRVTHSYTQNTFKNSLRDAEIFGFGFWKRNRYTCQISGKIFKIYNSTHEFPSVNFSVHAGFAR